MRTITGIVLAVGSAGFIAGIAIIANTAPSGRFSGELIAPLDGRNGVAIGLAGSYALEPFADIFTVYTDLDAEALAALLPVQSRGVLDRNERYDAVQLPFEIEVESIFARDEDIVQQEMVVTRDGESAVSAVNVGDVVRLGADVLQVADVRPWTGLYPKAGSGPMAQIAIKLPEIPWVENIFLNNDGWTRFEPDGAAKLVWCDSAEDAGDRIAEPIGPMDGAMWGVVDGDVTHRISGIEPGSGLQTSDGTDYTLIDYRPPTDSEPAAIAVNVAKVGEESVEVVTANVDSPDGPIRFSMPTAHTHCYVVYAWMTRAGASCIFSDVNNGTSVSAVESKVVPAPDTDLSVRLDRALPEAIAILPEESTVTEAIVAGAESVIRLRHAEPRTYGDFQIEFRRSIVPGVAELLLVADHRDEPEVTTFRLTPEQPRRILQWRLNLLPNPRPGMDVFLLRADYEPGLPLLTWFGTGLSLVSGVAMTIILLLNYQRSARDKND